MRGRGEQYKDFQQLLAWHLCHILNMFAKHTIMPDDLLGKSTVRHGLPDFNKIREHEFKKSIGMDSTLTDTAELIDPLLLNKFNNMR